MFLQHLFAPRIPRESPSAARRGSWGLIIPVAPGQGRHQLHASCFSASSTFSCLLPNAPRRVSVVGSVTLLLSGALGPLGGSK